jgi:hypothetical protein
MTAPITASIASPGRAFSVPQQQPAPANRWDGLIHVSFDVVAGTVTRRSLDGVRMADPRLDAPLLAWALTLQRCLALDGLESLSLGFRRAAPSPRNDDGTGAGSRLACLAEAIRVVFDRDESLFDSLASAVSIFIDYSPGAFGGNVAGRAYHPDPTNSATVKLVQLGAFDRRDLRRAFVACYAADPGWWDGVEFFRIGVKPVPLTAHRRLALAALAPPPKLRFSERFIIIYRCLQAYGRARAGR